jgi:hypothetical protein
MACEELKQRQATRWSSGPVEHIADHIANVHEHPVSEPAREYLIILGRRK